MVATTDQWPGPLAVTQAISNPEVAQRIRRILDGLPQDAPLGGLTIRFRPRPRVLVYVGPLPDKTDEQIRALVKALDDRYEVSPVRDPGQIKPRGVPRAAGQYRTATAENPTGS